MRPQAKEVYRLVKELHAQIYQATKELHQEAAECVDMQELADLAFAMRDTYKFLDDMRKVVDQTKKTAERMACLVWVKTESRESIRTEWCTATPQVRMMCKLPHRKRDPEQYAIMMESLGVSPDLYDQLEVVRPHWPGFVEYLTLLATKGKPLPKGLDPNKQYPIYSLLIRAKKELGLEENEETEETEMSSDAALRAEDDLRHYLMKAALVACKNDGHLAKLAVKRWFNAK